MACALFLSVQVTLPQQAVGAELDVGDFLSPALSNTFDARLFQNYFNLEVGYYSAQKIAPNKEKVVRQQTELIDFSKREVTFDELGVILPKASVVDFAAENRSRISAVNPLTPPFQFPHVAQPPVQSSTPDPLSLLMLSLGGVVLLGWSRHKRKLSAQNYRRATA